MKTKLSLLGLIVCLSCQQNIENKDVSQLREQLPQMQMPLKFNSDIKVKYKTVEIPDNNLIKALNQKSPFSLLGKLFETENNITILGYSFERVGSPIIVTFSSEGKEVSRHILFETSKAEPGIQTSNKVSIHPDRTIVFNDSTVFTKIDEAGQEITASERTVVTTKKYQISETGLIKIINK